MLDTDKIRELVDMMVANDLLELSLRDGDVEVRLRRPGPATGEGAAADAGRSGVPNLTVEAGGQGATLPSADVPTAEAEDSELVEIRSPMVGTFYAASSPDSPPFVQAGSQAHPGTVVCIVEAMKVFNEIKAEVTGTIERVLVKNEQPVEYGQPLFLVRPL